MKRYYVFSVILFFVIFVSSYCLAANPAGKNNNLELSGELRNGERVVEVRASRYKFEPNPIVVKLGEKVRVIVTSADITHGFAISKFNVNLVVNPSKSATAEFVADKEGEFTEYCTVYCGPGHIDMRGKFIVIK